MQAYKRFLNYAVICTSSEREQPQTPSSMQQFDLAHQLAFEMRELGLQDVLVDNHCFVYGKLSASPGLEDRPVLGLIAHLDTHPDYSGRHVVPQIFENYDGSDIPLGDSGLILSSKNFPDLKQLTGQTLITASGDTLLGADDKAGIAEILTALEQVIEGSRPHGPVSIAFIPDEELGSGTAYFDLARFGAEYAYTVDGWDVGEIVAETFNAVQAEIHFHGISTHTGRAKGRMINAQLLSLEFAAMMPPGETPSQTEGREGFFHLLRSCGTVDEAELVYNLRDFSQEGMTRRQNIILEAADQLNRRYGKDHVSVQFRERYHNMKAGISSRPQLTEKASAACLCAGVQPFVTYTRGGTDGARLTDAGLPCPNLGVGGWAYHGPYEHITAEAMDQVSDIIRELIFQYALPKGN